MTEARASSCFCPPDSCADSRWNQSSMPKKLAISATRRRITGVGSPRLSRPKASSCHTLSVTSWLSGDWLTKPMAWLSSRRSRSSNGRPRNKIVPSRVPWGAIDGLSWRSKVVLPQPD